MFLSENLPVGYNAFSYNLHRTTQFFFFHKNLIEAS